MLILPGEIVYVSGPMTNRPRFNFDTFNDVAATLRQWGALVYNPAEHDVEVDPLIETRKGFEEGSLVHFIEDSGFSFAEAMKWDLARCIEADVIVLLPGWETSTGAGHELAVAKVTGSRILYAVPVGRSWLFLTEDPNESAEAAAEEERVVNETTGGAKGSKLARFDLIPTDPLWQVAEHYGKGARKYDARNWELGYDWSLSYAALQRHAQLFWSGQDYDVDDTGSHHLTAVVFHALALMEWGRTHPELDDRPSTVEAR